jgi:hypothetical protein
MRFVVNLINVTRNTWIDIIDVIVLHIDYFEY